MHEIRQLIKKFEGKKIALYGLGAETKRVLKELDGDFEIIGLLDGFREEGTLYGKPILPISQVINCHAELILAAARPASCRAIAKRIGNLCRSNQIALLDIRGKDLLQTHQITYDFRILDGITKKELLKRIDRAEVISFDLFDTLVMRQTLTPEDVHEYVEIRLREKGVYIEDFCKKRLNFEKALSQYTAPSLTNIYRELLAHEDKKELREEELAQLEWEIDWELMVPRNEVCEMVQYACGKGKAVYLVSDSYYGKSKLMKLVQKCGISGVRDVFISSVYQKGKSQKLFQILKAEIEEERWLHIGDDPVADLVYASEAGLETCRLYSGVDLLEAAGYLGMAEFMHTLSDRLRIGMFVSHIFNSPFQFETEDRRIRVRDAEEIGYLFCAPLITDFVLWFRELVQKDQLDHIWFCARDGYLIRKLYHELEKERDSVYFLTSRTAAIRAGVEDEEDLRYVDEMTFSGSIQENMKQRFGIIAADQEETDHLSEEHSLMKYKHSILVSAKEARRNYQRYLNGLCSEDGDVAFFDFVAKGTVQMYIQRLTNHHLKGLYFLQLEAEQMKIWNLDIQAFYTREELEASAFFEYYYILEALLTAPFPSVQSFDKDGKPIYAEESRTEQDIKCFQRAQKGILEYFRTYTALCPAAEFAENKKLDERFLSMMRQIEITDKDFLSMVIEDPFFNRRTNMTDVL